MKFVSLPVARLGDQQRFSMDARALDLLTWTRHALKLELCVEAGTAAVMRRALAVYAKHLEAVIASKSGKRPGELLSKVDLEVMELRGAARGEGRCLPAEKLLAAPVKRFSEITGERE